MIRYSLLACLFLILVLAFVVFRYFILTFAVAASVSLLLAPAHDRLTRALGGRHSLAAALLVLLCTMVILVPVLSYGSLLVQQAAGFFDWVRPAAGARARWTSSGRRRCPPASRCSWTGCGPRGWAPCPRPRPPWAASPPPRKGVVQAVIAGLATAALDLIIFLMMVFFLLRDAPLLREQVRGISPFTRGQEAEMLDHLARTVRGVLQAMLVVPAGPGPGRPPRLRGLRRARARSCGARWSSSPPSSRSWAPRWRWVPAGLYLFSISQPRGIGLLSTACS